MKGFPKTIATGDDLNNCLALVQAGTLEAGELAQHIAAIEEREFTQLPILEISADRKTVVVMECEVLLTGAAVDNAAKTVINAVDQRCADGEALVSTDRGKQDSGGLPSKGGELVEASPEEGPSEARRVASVTLSKALPEGTAVLRVRAATDPYEALGTTKEDLNAIKEVLKNYE